MASEHLSKQYDVDLDGLRSLVLAMGGVVESQIRAALESFATGDSALADRVVLGDHEVDAYEINIDQSCAHVIARRQPAAGDLRMIMAISKTVTDLERVGDEAEKIARMAKSIHAGTRVPAERLRQIRHVAEIALAMLRQALDAFARLDASEASKAVQADAAIDEEFRAILRQLITYMMEDPRTISTALEIIWVAKAIERIGDHAKNIAEYVVYVVEGTDVRHAGHDLHEEGQS
jgi:phosphate transport system protein